MYRKHKLLALFLLVCVIPFVVNCSKEDIKVADKIASDLISGFYEGYATYLTPPSPNRKDMKLSITSKDNPVAGTYNLAGTTGNVSGSVLGNILNLTFKPTTTGVTYTFSGNTNDYNTAITGTMTGVESGTAVKYNVDLKK